MEKRQHTVLTLDMWHKKQTLNQLTYKHGFFRYGSNNNNF